MHDRSGRSGSLVLVDLMHSQRTDAFINSQPTVLAAVLDYFNPM